MDDSDASFQPRKIRKDSMVDLFIDTTNKIKTGSTLTRPFVDKMAKGLALKLSGNFLSYFSLTFPILYYLAFEAHIKCTKMLPSSSVNNFSLR